MYNYHDIFFYYAFGTLNGGEGSIQVIGITEGTTSVTFESNGKPLITYRIYGSSSGVGDLNAETGKYDITVTCNEDTYTISLDAPLMEGEYIDYKTQRLYPSGLDVSMPEISTVSGTNTLTVITTNPSSKVYVECYRAKDIPLPVASTIIGSVPFEFQCYEAGNLMDYSISGNAVQDGTPSADAPVDATGSGVRTGNLFPLDATKLHVGRIENDGTIDYEIGTITVGTNSVTYQVNTTWRGFYTDYIRANENEKLTFSPNDSASISCSCNCYDENDNFLGKAPAQSTALIKTFTTLAGTKKVRINVTSSFNEYTIENPMLNLGSTPLPYEPYGFKLPLTVNGTEYPIYLGQVETTRRVKKLVLTGEESFSAPYGNSIFYVFSSKIGIVDHIAYEVLCTHFARSETNAAMQMTDNEILLSSTSLYIRMDAATTVADWKSYLSAQYANGTPVTVWYVLAEPETAVVNEPLMKIGDYADTISAAQAGVTIPTIDGENILDMTSPVKPSEVYIKGKGIKPTGYGQLTDVNGVNILDKDGRPINVHGQ